MENMFLDSEIRESSTDDDQRQKKSKYRSLFDLETEYEPIQLRKSLVYRGLILLSDRCPHCINFSGLIQKGGLETLFANECVLRRVLLDENWKLGNLKVSYKKQYNSMKGEIERVEKGHAYMEKYYNPKLIIDKLYYKLAHDFHEFDLIKVKNLETAIDKGVNLCVERIDFYNVSIMGQILYRYFEDSVPYIFTKFTVGGEKGISEHIPEIELKKMLFYTRDYNPLRHAKLLSGKTAQWDSVFRKNVLGMK